MPQFFNKWVAHKLYAFDLSSIALRGATAALLSLTNDIDALKTMRLNWKTTDSLLNDDISNLKFDIIVGNPPWGKIKLSRHSLRTDNWHPVVKNAILEGLGARRGERVTPMGFINIADGGSYTNGR